MEIGSDLFNIIIIIGLLLFVIIVVYGILVVIRNNKTKHELKRVKNLAVFAIHIPKQNKPKENEPAQNFKELIAVADQFFASLANLYEGSFEHKFYNLQNQISLEITALDGKLDFYCVCPKEIASIVEKQINSYWPTAQITPAKLPNIFKSKKGAISVCNFKLAKKFIMPIVTYKYLESDPLNAVTNALSKLGEGNSAAIQLIVQPITDDWRRMAGITASKIQKGKGFVSEKWWMKVFNFLFEIFSGAVHGSGKKEEGSGSFKQPIQLTPIQEQQLKALNEKVSKTALATNLRIVTCAETDQEAKMNLKNITTAFAQFSSPEMNGFKAKMAYADSIKDYILRRFIPKGMILNAEELASIFHFPSQYVETPNIDWLMAKEMAPPANLPAEGTIIGESVYRGEKKAVRIKTDDRRRHIFMIGKTGTGKTTLFTNMIEQDMAAGRGCCFIDPNGDAIEELLGKVPQNRIADVVLFDPGDQEYPMGLNLMEWKTVDERDFLIQEAISIFYKLFDPGNTGIVGPQWEHWFRNAAITIMSQPGGGTLLDVPRIFTDDAFRTRLIAYVKDPIVKAFWDQQLAKTADFHKSEMYNYFISKFGRFTTNDLMRNIIGQRKSAFNIREMMDQNKILFLNLSKGKIGEINSNLLGMILVSKIQMAAFSRADTPEDQRQDFYLFVDEFQNFTTDSFATILSEARKYRLNLAVANQYIAQLTDKIRDAVIGNAGTMISYRIGAADAEFMIKEFPGATIDDLSNLDKFNTYTKLLIDGTPTKPFSMHGIKSPVPAIPEVRQQVKDYNHKNYARPKAEVDAEIFEQIKALAGGASAPGNNGPINNL